MSFFNALGGVFSLLLLVGLGYGLAARGWFSADAEALLPKLVTNVALPPFLMGTIIKSFTHDNLLHLVASSFLPLGGLCFVFLAAMIMGKLFHVERKHFGLFCACISNSNTIFIGIPVNLALFGKDAVHYALLYYFGSTFFFWTVGHFAVSKDRINENAAKFDFFLILRRLFSPPLLGFFIGLLFVFFDVYPSEFLLDTIGYIGNMTTPLALMYVGISLQRINFRSIKISKDVWIALFGRLVLSPFIFFLWLSHFHIHDLMQKVFIIQSSLPVLTQAAILSAFYKTDSEFGSLMVSLSTVFSAITIPIYMIII